MSGGGILALFGAVFDLGSGNLAAAAEYFGGAMAPLIGGLLLMSVAEIIRLLRQIAGDTMISEHAPSAMGAVPINVATFLLT